MFCAFLERKKIRFLLDKVEGIYGKIPGGDGTKDY